MSKCSGKQERLDAFLKSVIQPAAAEYAESIVRQARHTKQTIPCELDSRCKTKIYDFFGSVKGNGKVFLMVAVIAALLGTSVFAMYNEDRQGLVMRDNKFDDASRITFSGETAQIAETALQSAGEILFDYIPAGFELVYQDDQSVIYMDENGSSFVIDRTRLNMRATIMLNTEDEDVAPIVCKGYEGYKSIGESDGQLRISYLWYDTDEQMTYKLMTVGLEENEILKIMDGMNYENQ